MKSWRAIAVIFAGLLIWVPFGLIAPGGAFGEDTPATQEEVDAALAARAAGDSSLFDALPDVNQECECVPVHINDVSYSGGPLPGYAPPWVSEDDPVWKQNLGYQFAGLGGIAIVGVFVAGAYWAGRKLMPSRPADWRTAR